MNKTSVKNEGLLIHDSGALDAKRPRHVPLRNIKNRLNSENSVSQRMGIRKGQNLSIRESEKLVSDLKKQNFDLKLQLFHLTDKSNLAQKNVELRREIEDLRDKLQKANETIQDLKNTIQNSTTKGKWTQNSNPTDDLKTNDVTSSQTIKAHTAPMEELQTNLMSNRKSAVVNDDKNSWRLFADHEINLDDDNISGILDMPRVSPLLRRSHSRSRMPGETRGLSSNQSHTDTRNSPKPSSPLAYQDSAQLHGIKRYDQAKTSGSEVTNDRRVDNAMKNITTKLDTINKETNIFYNPAVPSSEHTRSSKISKDLPINVSRNNRTDSRLTSAMELTDPSPISNSMQFTPVTTYNVRTSTGPKLAQGGLDSSKTPITSSPGSKKRNFQTTPWPNTSVPLTPAEFYAKLSNTGNAKIQKKVQKDSDSKSNSTAKTATTSLDNGTDSNRSLRDRLKRFESSKRKPVLGKKLYSGTRYG
ncbi:10867_t:CDS:2 [Paraglomus brasilianum]|uniref:10867_t:CDS:1 n=1 Tax=Paraglomus brasilianum TaxID=144538 RepID=A0A9N8WK00_9GLOM|nr:10867_t:CDS:2 [Paraglomus brasilianum]